jgi:hypothetical protein
MANGLRLQNVSNGETVSIICKNKGGVEYQVIGEDAIPHFKL